jgi:hypothetical protein
MYHATWAGITDPRQAITGPEATRQHGDAPAAPLALRDAPALPPGDAPPVTTRRASPRKARHPSQADTEAQALAVLARQPDIGGAELGRVIGASPRTGQRLLARLSSRATEVDDAQAAGPDGAPAEIPSLPGIGPDGA